MIYKKSTKNILNRIKKYSIHKKKKNMSDFTFIEIGLVGLTLYGTDRLLLSMDLFGGAGDILGLLLKFGLQAFVVLWVDSIYKKA